MKERAVDTLPPCDICRKVPTGPDACIIDAPTVHGGSWANMCTTCRKQHAAPGWGTIGTKLVIRKPVEPSPTKDTVLDVVDINSPEDIIMDGAEREVKCPNCGEVRTIEQDADCVFTCEGCQQKLRVRDILTGIL